MFGMESSFAEDYAAPASGEAPARKMKNVIYFTDSMNALIFTRISLKTLKMIMKLKGKLIFLLLLHALAWKEL